MSARGTLMTLRRGRITIASPSPIVATPHVPTNAPSGICIASAAEVQHRPSSMQQRMATSSHVARRNKVTCASVAAAAAGGGWVAGWGVVAAAVLVGAIVGGIVSLFVVKQLRQSVDPMPIVRENAVLREKVGATEGHLAALQRKLKGPA